MVRKLILVHDKKRPSCCTKEQYENWRAMSKIQRGQLGYIQAGFCTDCTPEYCEKMKKQNKCDYADVIKFEYDADGFLSGVLK